MRRETTLAKSAAALGLASIVGGIVGLSSGVPFPSHYALLPVGGTALVILFCDARHGIGRLLGLRPVVGIGLVSYSFYLWHQPLFAFARLASPAHPSERTLLLLALVALGLAVLSWAFVERPFRTGKGRRFARRSIALGMAAAALFAGFWVYAEASKGVRGRLKPTSDAAMLAFVRSRVEQAPVPPGCRREADDAMQPCLAYGRPDARRRIAVFGDSHAGAILPALEVLGRTPDTAIVYGWRGGCPPFLGVYVLAGNGASDICAKLAEAELAAAVRARVDTDLLVGRWRLYTALEPGSFDPHYLLSRKAIDASADYASSRRVLDGALRTTVAAYRRAGMRVVVLDQVPQQEIVLDRYVDWFAYAPPADRAAAVRDSSVTIRRSDAEAAFASTTLARSGAAAIDPRPLFADGRLYLWGDASQSWYRDENHVSAAGARRLAPLLARELGLRPERAPALSP